MFRYTAGDKMFTIEVSEHASKRLEQRNTKELPAYGCIVSITDKIMEIEVGQEFAVIDPNAKICVIGAKKNETEINIVTVIDSSFVYVKEGVKLHNSFAMNL